MHDIPLYIAILISVPQTIIILEFGFRLFNIKISTKQIILTSIIMAVGCYFLRAFSIPYVLNTLTLIALLSLCVHLVGSISLRYCFSSVVLGVMIYGMLESLLLPMMINICGASFEELINDPCFNLISFIPVLMIAILLLGVIIKKDVILYDFGSEEYEK